MVVVPAATLSTNAVMVMTWGDGVTANPRVITIGTNNNYTAIFSPTTAVETLTFNNVSRTAPI